MHGLRAVRAGLPRGLHQLGDGYPTARQRYAFHRLRVERQGAEQDERLAAKAASKLSDLESASQLTDPDALARKRVVVEAALARARARRRNTAGG